METIEKVKMSPTERGKMFANHTSGQELMSRIHNVISESVGIGPRLSDLRFILLLQQKEEKPCPGVDSDHRALLLRVASRLVLWSREAKV